MIVEVGPCTILITAAKEQTRLDLERAPSDG
jgi:hypothetical protein